MRNKRLCLVNAKFQMYVKLGSGFLSALLCLAAGDAGDGRGETNLSDLPAVGAGFVARVECADNYPSVVENPYNGVDPYYTSLTLPEFVAPAVFREVGGTDGKFVVENSRSHDDTDFTPAGYRDLTTDDERTQRIKTSVVKHSVIPTVYTQLVVKPDASGTVYVKETATGRGDGSSWDNAYAGLADPLWLADLQRGNTFSVAVGDTIRAVWVAEGTYYPKYEAGAVDDDGNPATVRDRAFVMVAGVKVYGGFPANASDALHGSLTARDVGGFERTVLSGTRDNVYHVVVVSDIPNEGTSLLDGFTVTGGRADTAGRVLVRGTATIESFVGGGINDGYSRMLYVNVAVRGNFALKDGGGVGFQKSHSKLTNVLVAGNESASGEGAVGGLGYSATLTNVTVAGNRGDGISGTSGAKVQINNSIVWGNSGVSMGGTVVPQYVGSVLEGVQLSGNEGFGDYPNSNPRFVAPVDPSAANWTPTTAGDYRLSVASPLIDKGDNAAYLAARGVADFTGESDAAGNPRLVGNPLLPVAVIDIGAHEFQLLRFAVKPDAAGTVYVKEGASGTGDGSSWDNACDGLADPLYFAELQRRGKAVAAAADTVRAIWVAEGNYAPKYEAAEKDRYGYPSTIRDRAFSLVGGVEVYGGFPANASASSHPTVESRGKTYAEFGRSVLDGSADSVYHVVVAAEIPTVEYDVIEGPIVFDGFTVAGGNADAAIGRYVYSGTIVRAISSCDGGGIYVLVGAPVRFANLTVDDNFAARFGGGLYYGGGRDSASLTCAVVAGNKAEEGGGIFGSKGRMSLTNVLVAGNESTSGYGAIAGSGCSATLTNVTVAGNRGDGITDSDMPSVPLLIRNSIVWGNTGVSVRDAYPQYVRSVLEGVQLSGNEGFGDYPNSNPRFVAPVDPSAANWTPTTAGDYRLSVASPLIDKGDNAAYLAARGVADFTGESDAAGNPRLVGNPLLPVAVIDIGAHEFQLLRFAVKPDAAGTVYVKEGASGTGDGSSWDNACDGLADPLYFAELQRRGKAVAAAADTVRAIWVAEGNYAPKYEAAEKDRYGYPSTIRDRAFSLVGGVEVYGGFPANASASSHPTVESRGKTYAEFGRSVLDGSADSVYHVVVAAEIPTVEYDVIEGPIVFDGFTVAGGNADAAIGRYVYSGTIVRAISSCDGGGIYVLVGAPVRFANLTVDDNFAARFGGGLYYGGGRDSASLTCAVVAGNKAEEGGGIFGSKGRMSLTNVLVAGNESTSGYGAIAGSGCSATLTNVTVAGNRGDGITDSDMPSVPLLIRNSIVWGNTGVSVRDAYPQYVRSLAEGVQLSGNEGFDGTNPVYNPSFVAPVVPSRTTSNSDYSVADNSPLVDAGDNGVYLAARGVADFSGETDLAGKARLQGARIDVGAYERRALRVFSVKSDSGGTVYVKVNGTGDGSSWERAYPGLADPLQLADRQRRGKLFVAPGDTIRRIFVAEGTYAPKYEAGERDAAGVSATPRDRAFVMVAGVKVYGGFPAGATSVSHPSPEHRAVSSSGAESTVLSGAADRVYHVVVAADIPNDGQTILDGFAVTGGVADGTGRSLVMNGTALESDAGGGILDVRSAMRYVNLSVRGNYAERGGAVYCDDGSVSMIGTLVAGNESASGDGAIDGRNYSATFANLTVAGNRAGGIAGYQASSRIYNTIIWKNTGVSVPRSPSPHYVHCLVSGLPLNENEGFNSRSFLNSPLFFNPVDPSGSNWTPTVAGDYRLLNDSPFIDAGKDAAYLSARGAADFAGETDLAGNPRIAGARTDIGAYETVGRAFAVARINPDAAGRVFVKRGGAGTGDGSSWENAYPGLADPLYLADKHRRGEPWAIAAADTIRQIWVAEGAYSPEYKVTTHVRGLYPTTDRDKTFLLVKGVKLYGGFPDTATSATHPVPESRFASGCRSIACMPRTVLSGDLNGDDIPGDFATNVGDNAYHVVVACDMAATDSATADGFTVTRGIADGNGHVTMNGIKVIQNKGGGVAVIVSTVAMDRMAVVENLSANGEGGGFVVEDNFRQSAGLALSRSSVSGNSGGGIYAVGNVGLFDVLVAGNYSSISGGVYVVSHNYQSAVEIVNSTIVGNGSDAYGALVTYHTDFLLANSIVWGNVRFSQSGPVADNLEFIAGSASASLSNNIVEGSGTNGAGLNFGYTQSPNLSDNTDEDPLFAAYVDPRQTNWTPTLAGDYSPKYGSPAINSGDDAAYLSARGVSDFAGATDFAGNPRLSGTRIDRGAYELQRVTFNPDSAYITFPVADDTLICAGAPFTLRGWYMNRQIMVHPSTVTLDYSWEHAADSLFTASVTVVQSGSFAGGLLPVACTFNPTERRHEGYYRFAVENNSNEGQHFRVVSRVVRVRVFERHRIPDVRLFAYPSAGMFVNLSSLLDMRYPPGHKISWIPSPGSPSLVAGTETGEGRLDVGTWQPSVRTYTYIYELDFCGVGRAKVYVHTGRNFSRTDTIHVCLDANGGMNALVNLNPILGVVSGGGAMDFPDDPTHAIFSNVHRDTNGAVFLDVAKAYAAATDRAYLYKGDASVKQFAIRYYDANVARMIVVVVRLL